MKKNSPSCAAFSGRLASKSDQRGLTLIELLVVLGVIAFIFSIVIINMAPRQGIARQEAAQFERAFRGVYDEALINGGGYRLVAAESEWRFERYSGNEWRAVAVPGAAKKRPAGNLLLDLTVEEKAKSNLSALTGERPIRPARGARARQEDVTPIDPYGETTAFTLEFLAEGESWVVRFDGAGALTKARR